jgi:hypothetical protein
LEIAIGREAFLDEHVVKKKATSIMTEISIIVLYSDMDEWLQRLMQHVELGGNYLS